MDNPPEFSFGDQSVAAAYDAVLVPILFEPWATHLVEAFKPWLGRSVLDLATGTGIVAQQLAMNVGTTGKVICADINAEMLDLARARCADAPAPIEFVESPAHPLALPGESVDVVVCQQGYQFFPDKASATAEMFRVLRSGGKVIVTTWRPVAECEFFDKICDTLEAIGEQELSNLMRAPFDHMPEPELKAYFEAGGFTNVQVIRHQRDLAIHGGVPRAVEVAYSTPIGPELRLLPGDRQAQFRAKLSERLEARYGDGSIMGRMASNVLLAEKAC